MEACAGSRWFWILGTLHLLLSWSAEGMARLEIQDRVILDVSCFCLVVPGETVLGETLRGILGGW
jgi:hypothetical protein